MHTNQLSSRLGDNLHISYQCRNLSNCKIYTNVCVNVIFMYIHTHTNTFNVLQALCRPCIMSPRFILISGAFPVKKNEQLFCHCHVSSKVTSGHPFWGLRPCVPSINIQQIKCPTRAREGGGAGSL